jgi:hypothetical protein
MRHLTLVLVVLAAVAFVLAVVGALMGQDFLNVAPEGFSRACTNLALLAVAVVLVAHRKHA